MFDRFEDDRRVVLDRARDEARELGSATVEAEHLLLALTHDAGLAGEVLAESDLDGDTLREALTAEFERSLRTVGVSVVAFDLPPAPPPPGKPRLGTSAKAALLRAARAALARGDRRVSSTHILLGLLRARAGTVPRTLDVAGVDIFVLAARTEAALDRGA